MSGTEYQRAVVFSGWSDGRVFAEWSADQAYVTVELDRHRTIEVEALHCPLSPSDARALAHDLPLILTELADRAEGKT